MTYVAVRAMTLELLTSFVDSFRSGLISSESSGGKAYHDQKATKKPNQEKKKTRPYWLNGFKAGMVRAFLLMGLTTGADHRLETPMFKVLITVPVCWKYSD